MRKIREWNIAYYTVPQGIRAHGGMNGAVRHKATPRLNLHCHLSVEEMFETECGHTPT